MAKKLEKGDLLRPYCLRCRRALRNDRSKGNPEDTITGKKGGLTAHHDSCAGGLIRFSGKGL